MRWSKYWCFSFNTSPSNEYSELISFRMDWLNLLAHQGTHKSLLQHHSSKASILWCSAFFIVQLSHPYMTTGKSIALTRPIFVGKVISLLFNILSRLFITFLPRKKGLLISWLQSPFAVTLEPSRLLCSWDSLGKNTGVGSHSLLQGIFPIQGSNAGLLHCRQIQPSPGVPLFQVTTWSPKQMAHPWGLYGGFIASA